MTAKLSLFIMMVVLDPKTWISREDSHKTNYHKYSEFVERVSSIQTQKKLQHSVTSQTGRSINCSASSEFRHERWSQNEGLVSMPLLQQLSSTTFRGTLEGEVYSLVSLLLYVEKTEMAECDLVVAYDGGYDNPNILMDILMLPNQKQVVRIVTVRDLLRLSWESSHCNGYIILMSEPGPLIAFGNEYLEDWNYGGRYLFVLPTSDAFKNLTTSVKGKKTEHLAAAIQSPGPEWILYVNQLFRNESMKRLTSWRGGGFTISEQKLYSSAISALRGTTLKAVTFEWHPSIFYSKSKDGSVLDMYGIDVGVIKTLSEVLDFTLLFEEPPKGEFWGRLDDGGSWNGLMGKLDRNEVDMGVADIYVTLLRYNILSFTDAYDSEMYCFMARKHLPVPRWQALAFPFQGITWLALFIGLIISGPVLYLLTKASSQCREEVHHLQSLTSSWYYVLGMHCCESHRILPRNRSTQVFVVFMWLYTMIITIAYSSNLTAFLTVDRPQAAIETIQEIHETSTEVSGMGKEVSADSDINLRGLAKLYKGYDKHETIVKQVLKGESVFMANRLHLKYLVATILTTKGSPRSRLLRECFLPFNVAVALQRHSPLKKKFDMVIGWMKNGGLIQNFFEKSLLRAKHTKVEEKAKSKEYLEEGEEDDEAASGVIPISLDHLQSIFYIYGISCLISTLLFLIELYSFRKLSE